MTSTLAITLAFAMGTVVGLWALSLPLRNVSIVDIWWGPGFAGIAWVAWASGPASSRATLVAVLTTVWGLRLGAYLWHRNAGRDEDYRYASMRAEHGDRFPWRSLATVFLLQGGIMWVVSLPVQLAAGETGTDWWWGDAIGLVLWTVGIVFETIGDWQLARFKKDPANAGRVMNRGLWRYTRHPNYFGDFLVWWGLFALAVSAPHGWLTVVSPVLMSVLLLRVSGVRLLEQTIADRRPDYAEYARTTNAFFPGPSRARG